MYSTLHKCTEDLKIAWSSSHLQSTADTSSTKPVKAISFNKVWHKHYKTLAECKLSPLRSAHSLWALHVNTTELLSSKWSVGQQCQKEGTFKASKWPKDHKEVNCSDVPYCTSRCVPVSAFSHMRAHVLYTPRKFKRCVSAELKVLKAKIAWWNKCWSKTQRCLDWLCSSCSLTTSESNTYSMSVCVCEFCTAKQVCQDWCERI